jgi:hypothetical protein
MNRTAFFHSVSNRWPEKCGLGKIKRANPDDEIHPPILGYETHITDF